MTTAELIDEIEREAEHERDRYVCENFESRGISVEVSFNQSPCDGCAEIRKLIDRWRLLGGGA